MVIHKYRWGCFFVAFWSWIVSGANDVTAPTSPPLSLFNIRTPQRRGGRAASNSGVAEAHP